MFKFSLLLISYVFANTNPFSGIMNALSSEKCCPTSMPFLLTCIWCQADCHTNLLWFQGAQPDHLWVESSSCCFPRECEFWPMTCDTFSSNWKTRLNWKVGQFVLYLHLNSRKDKTYSFSLLFKPMVGLFPNKATQEHSLNIDKWCLSDLKRYKWPRISFFLYSSVLRWLICQKSTVNNWGFQSLSLQCKLKFASS